MVSFLFLLAGAGAGAGAGALSLGFRVEGLGNVWVSRLWFRLRCRAYRCKTRLTSWVLVKEFSSYHHGDL